MAVIAVIGNPNSGKSSLFNALTGMRQKVANYPGVTVDVKSARHTLPNGEKVTLVDMPGLYSMYPSSADGRQVADILLNPDHQHHPAAVIYTVDIAQLEAQLMLFTQIRDLGLPVLLAVNMIDAPGYTIDYASLSKRLGVPVIPVSSKTRENLDGLTDALPALLQHQANGRDPFFRVPEGLDGVTDYAGFIRFVRSAGNGKSGGNGNAVKLQMQETMARSEEIRKAITGSVKSIAGAGWSGRIDRVVTHRLAGPLIFLVIMLLVFQAIFAWALWPMEGIEWAFGKLGAYVNDTLPEGWFTSLLAEGLIPGLSGVLMFVPQIAILFFLIAILEESGYMARAVFLFDRLLQRFGMNGRSLVSLISGGACAIPAILSTRTIENRKERLITILVTPFISCSARIPVFTVLIAFVVPYKQIAGIFNSQGLMFAALYAGGAIAALGAAWVFKQILPARDMSFLMLELPSYRSPSWINVWTEVKSKAGAFVTQAGRVIIMIALVLWFLASYGPGVAMQRAEEHAKTEALAQNLDEEAAANLVASERLEASFAGMLGRTIEPAIRPLGYDWKIGIALITSFAAREVFVGSMATIYSVGSDVDEFRLREYLAGVTDPRTGKNVFNFATALSLILFYLLALQCMSTMAVVWKETGTWKWPLIQFLFMGGLAYLVSFIAYQWAS